MSLELKIQRDGSYRNTWYGRFEINGRKIFANLGVKVAGTPPESGSIRDEGDRAFERSRATAQAKLDSLVEEARSKRNVAALAEKIYEIKTGVAVKSVKLEDLVEEWKRIPRRRKLNAIYAAQCQATVERFVNFLRAKHPRVAEVAQVSRTIALAFLEGESGRGLTGKTWNDKLKVLRMVFKHALPPGCINPLAEVPSRETETVFRIPFTPEELVRITEAAKADEFIRPIIMVGMCTAMRRGDCCLLQWKDVDLKNRFITVKTAKTGNTVSIPIFPMLLEELEKKAEKLKTETRELAGEWLAGEWLAGEWLAGEGSGRGARNDRRDACAPQTGTGYVFPEQAETYLRNPDGITLRVKRVLASALMGKAETLKPESASRTGEQKSVALPEVTEAEVRRRGEEFLAGLPASEKRERMGTVFRCYREGKSLDAVVTATGVSKTCVSDYLKEIEAGAQCRIVRGRPDGTSMSALLRKSKDLLSAERAGGGRRASVRDFHSFRVTWVTLALTAGVPLELVQKVTGHKTTDIVLKHYFQPGREAFREALQKAMPALLTNGGEGRGARGAEQRTEASKRDQAMRAGEIGETISRARAIVEKMTARTLARDKARLLEMLKG